MKDQHTKIKGYRDLSQEEIDLMNEIKQKGEELNVLVRKVQDHLAEQRIDMANSRDALEEDRLNTAEPTRWAAMARTDLQVGIMKLVRAVAQPTSF